MREKYTFLFKVIKNKLGNNSVGCRETLHTSWVGIYSTGHVNCSITRGLSLSFETAIANEDSPVTSHKNL